MQSQFFRFNSVFKLIEKIRATMNIQKRFTCLIENILIRRNENWRESEFIEKGPETMDKIYEDHLNKDQPKETPRGHGKKEGGY